MSDADEEARSVQRRATMIERAEEAFGSVDVLVNVVGVMLPASITEADPADWRRMVDVNLLGVLYATRAALPGMLERGDGHIVTVSSTSGRVASPLFSVYAATKHSLGAFTEVLRKEVHPRRVRVTLFEPGPTKSELGSHADPEAERDLIRACRPRGPSQNRPSSASHIGQQKTGGESGKERGE
jgi:NADP-dependent 3-hydroxy acid dehydrogenase YdfG